MNRHHINSRPGQRNRLTGFLLALMLGLNASVRAASYSEWEHQQRLNVPSSGIVRIALPVDTLDAAQPNLADLRVVDPAGNETPYLVSQAAVGTETLGTPRKFEVSMNSQGTVMVLETGVAQPLAEVTLVTPEASFIKAVRIEGSADQRDWKLIADGQPIFRQPNGASQLRLAFSPGIWAYLRVTIDDSRSRPIPFTGAMLRVQGESGPTETFPVQIRERADFPGQTRLALNFGAAHLSLTDLSVETPDPLFTRQVTLAMQDVVENVITEKTLARGTIFRVALENQPPVSQLHFPVNLLSPRRELLLLIQNDDNPPLAITAIRAERRPVYLTFHAVTAGDYTLFSGNKKVVAPRYDLAALGGNLKDIPVNPWRISAIAANPGYQPGETLPDISTRGAPLDISGWRFRKAITVERAGVQQLELDLDVLAHAQPGLADLRLMREDHQVPMILERTSLSRPIALKLVPVPDPKAPRLSRWLLDLSGSNLPITKITCQSQTALFTRSVSLYEEIRNDRGEISKRTLGQAQWIKTPGTLTPELVLPITSTPTSQTVFLQMDNGDNPPVELEKLQAFYPVSRILFKTDGDKPLALYYGNARVGFPSYDLNLVARQLLAADKILANAGAEEVVKTGSTFARALTGKAGLVFWIVLGLVVLGLLVIISRLLPKSIPTDPAKQPKN